VKPSADRYSDRRRLALLIGLSVALVVAGVFLHVAFGSVRIPLSESLAALFGRSIDNAVWQRIIQEFRIPRALTAAAAGAGLAVCGVLMQTLFRNPLAGPFVLGVSSGASLGVALVILAGSWLGVGLVSGSGLLAGVALGGDLTVAAAAVLGAGGVMLIILAVNRIVDSVLTLLVLGVLFSYAVGAVVSVLMHFSIPEQIQSYVNWTFGSFAGVTLEQLPVFCLLVGVGFASAVLLSKPLNALLLGESYAATMGIRVRLVRTLSILVTAVTAGVITAFCGPIGFLGIAIPHLTRALLRDADHRVLIPLSAVLGAGVALFADLAAALPGTAITLPLNAVTALIGAPVVIGVVLGRGGLGERFG
jgi:iron complex transport system permease protein